MYFFKRVRFCRVALSEIPTDYENFTAFVWFLHFLNQTFLPNK